MKLAKLVNLTPHEIRIFIDRGEVSIPPSGQVARCTEAREATEVIELGPDGVRIPVNTVSFGELSSLPDPQPGVGHIVSMLAGRAAAARGRDDVFVADEAVRDSAGRIIGCRALAKP